MKRSFLVGGSLLAALLTGAVLWVLWASTGRVSKEDRAQIKRYDAAFQAGPDTITVMTYNIGYLSGMTNNEPVVRPDSFLAANMEQALRLIQQADPDVIGVQEIDYGAARSGYVQQLDTIATRLGYATAAQAVNWDERYIPFPYGRPAVHFGRTLSGQALLSRFRIRDHTRKVLARPPQWIGRDRFYLDRLAQITVLTLGGRALFVLNLHLEAFHQGTREQQARTVRTYYNRLTEAGAPVLVIGDLNSDPSSSSNGRGEAQASADQTLALLTDGTTLRPVFPDTARAPTASTATFPADDPQRKIDYILYPPGALHVTERRVQCGTPSPPSDHCAVTASFRLVDATGTWPPPGALPRLDMLLSE